MRKQIVEQHSLFDQAINLLLSIFKPEKELKLMDTLLDENPHILDAVHEDLTHSTKKSGRKGLSAESILDLH